MKIVVAEDEILNQRLLVTLLRRLGHQVHCVSNGRELIEYLSDEHPDIAFIDVHMPVMDGIEAVRAIVRRWRPAVRPVLIGLSATVDMFEIEECLSAGMDGFLPKPANAHTLQETIDAWTERKRSKIPIWWGEPFGPSAPFPLPSLMRQ